MCEAPRVELPRTEVYAFSQPVVKAGQMSVAMRLAGCQHVLEAHRSVWHGLHDHLKEFFAQGPAVAEPPLNKSHGALAHRGAGAKKCAIAWVDLTADLTQTVQAVAAKHGIIYGSLQTWIAVHHPREVTALRRAAGLNQRPQSAPVLKPSGRIL